MEINQYTCGELEDFLDRNNPKIMELYDKYQNSDDESSYVGLLEILLYQQILKDKELYGDDYCKSFDKIKLRFNL